MSRSFAAIAALGLWFVAACGGRAPEGPETPPVEPVPVDTVDVPREPEPEPADEAPLDSLPAPEAFPEPAPLPPLQQPIRACATGDVLIGNNLDTLWARRASDRLGYFVEPTPEPSVLLEPLGRLVGDADIVLLNVEGAIGEGAAPSKCRPGSTRCYAFRQPRRTAAALRALAWSAEVVANVANNHALDAGVSGYGATISHLRRAGVHVTGTDTLATPVVLSSSDSVGVLGFSPFVAGPDPRDLAAVRRHVRRARDRYGRVIVTMHMGAEGHGAQRTPNVSERFFGEDRGNAVAFARAAVEAGASLVFGHGPHVLRAGEWWGDGLIFYSLGNTLTYGPFNLREPSNRGGVACATVEPGGWVADAVIRSVIQTPPGLMEADPTRRGAFLVDSLSRLDFPQTGLRVEHDSLVVREN